MLRTRRRAHHGGAGGGAPRAPPRGRAGRAVGRGRPPPLARLLEDDAADEAARRGAAVAMRGLAASSARHESLVQPKPLRALLAPVVALPRQPAVGCAALGALAALAEPGDVREALLSSLLPAVGRAGLLEAIEKHAPSLADAHLPAATLLAVLASVCLTSLAPAAGGVRGAAAAAAPAPAPAPAAARPPRRPPPTTASPHRSPPAGRATLPPPSSPPSPPSSSPPPLGSTALALPVSLPPPRPASPASASAR